MEEQKEKAFLYSLTNKEVKNLNPNDEDTNSTDESSSRSKMSPT